jgi:hypothetical protein
MAACFVDRTAQLKQLSNVSERDSRDAFRKLLVGTPGNCLNPCNRNVTLQTFGKEVLWNDHNDD